MTVAQGCSHGGNGHGGDDGDPGRNWRSDDQPSKEYADEKRKLKSKRQLENGILTWVSS